MKTKMNIICVLIFISIIASFTEFYINSGGEIRADIKKGYDEGSTASTRALLHDSDSVLNSTERMFINLRPKDYSTFADSVFNETSGQWIPAQYRGTVVIEQPLKHYSILEKLLIVISAFIFLIAGIILFIKFISLIYKINKSVIFHWTNVSKLRWIGGCMIAMFLASGVSGWMHNLANEANIRLTDYIISYEGIWDFQLFISGLGVFLVAEIFAIGLRLQEEQDLTI